MGSMGSQSPWGHKELDTTEHTHTDRIFLTGTPEFCLLTPDIKKNCLPAKDPFGI